jgi:hypothetical protein
MCKWGNDVKCKVLIPESDSHTGKKRWVIKGVDSCLADIIQALNDAKIYTATSCCGHGKRRGTIQLQDGRKLIIVSKKGS